LNHELLALTLVAATVLTVGAGARRRPRARVVVPAPTIRHSGGSRRDVVARHVARFRSRPQIRPAEVAGWCDDVARRVRSGTSLSQALIESVPGDEVVRDATAPIRLAIERGRPVADAVANIDSGDPSPRGNRHLATACSVIAVSARLGGASAAPLHRAAAALRLRAVDDAERLSHSAQARLSAHVLTVIPVGMLGLLVTTDPDVRAVVVEPIGTTCVTAGLALNATGWLWMRHTIGRRP